MQSKYIAYGVAAVLLLFAAFTVQPFAPTIDAETTLVEQPGTYASDIRRLPDATYLVAVRAPMPRCLSRYGALVVQRLHANHRALHMVAPRRPPVDGLGKQKAR